MIRTSIVKTNLSSNDLFYDEWLVTNGLGGFACGSLCCAPMRKHHALLVASLPAPYGRVAMLNHVADSVILPDKREFSLSLIQLSNDEAIQHFPLLEFRLEAGLPVWRYKIEDFILEKSLFLIHHQNTVIITYKLIGGKNGVLIKWAPYLHFLRNEDPLSSKKEIYNIHAHGNEYEIECEDFPFLRLTSEDSASFVLCQSIYDILYQIEAERGYACQGSLTSPGYFLMSLEPGNRKHLMASTESWQNMMALNPSEAWIIERQRRKELLKNADAIIHSKIAAKLVLAADQFIIAPKSRHEDVIRLEAAGEQVKSVIAGYPWFTDWGRDTMISLEGLTLVTGRTREAHAILRTFAHYIKDGLIPNVFPEGEKKGVYNTADASLWFFHAVHRYIEMTNDEDILEMILPKLENIIKSHLNGTLFGIKVDKDGLLIQGEEKYQLTWMDAKVGDWVVTPRRGKAVEINALWYNALKLFEKWTQGKSDLSDQCYDSFNKRFWYNEGNYLYDVIDGESGNDSSLRPNQLFSISLDFPVLSIEKWKSVLHIVHQELLTPVGLRTLSPKHPNYKACYDGDLRARDAAYHQGTVWPWLLGPFVDVWLKVYPEDYESAKNFIKPLEEHLETNCIGSISEIFDACSPYHARGCFAQAWSVAELLRCLVKVNPSWLPKLKPRLKDNIISSMPL